MPRTQIEHNPEKKMDDHEMMSEELEENLLEWLGQALESVAEVAKLMPSGSLLASQLVTPLLLNRGQGATIAGLVLVALCGITCMLSTFTDTIKDGCGRVHYGIATFRGLWIVDGSPTRPLPPQVAARYKLKLIDFAHALMSLLVFVAVAVFDQDVVRCFYPNPSEKEELVFAAVPLLCVVCGFPLETTRYWLSTHSRKEIWMLGFWRTIWLLMKIQKSK